jgi:large subunit ribosomal protein L25
MGTTLQVQAREVKGRAQLRKIRSQGYIPGVIYGKGLSAPSNISIEAKELMALLRTHPHAVIEVEVPGEGKHPVMMSDLQRDPLSRQVTHIDFHRIDMNQKITTPVRLDFIGVSLGEKEGGMLQQVLYEIEIECYPRDIPDTIPVDVGELTMGDHLSVSDLKLAAGLKATQDPGTVIVAVLAPQKERTEDELEAIQDKEEEDRKHSEAAQAVDKVESM